MRMNNHSHFWSKPLAVRDSQDARRVMILRSAERCFVRRGFHRATMQDVAAEAQMSAGNLYRYFPSKDAIVAGLTERDHTEMVADFAALSDGPLTFERLEAWSRRHFREKPREKAVMMLEIWAESTRNPAVAALTGGIEQAARQHLCLFLCQLQMAGVASPDLDVGRAALALMMLVEGFFKQRALDPNLDLDLALDALFGAMRAVLGVPSGHVLAGAAE